MKQKLSTIFLKFQVLAILLIVIDQVTKFIFRTYFEVGEYVPVIENFFYIKLIYNTGAAASIFEGQTWLLTIFSILACVAIEYYLIKHKPKDWILVTILLVLLAGAFGNLIDRLFAQKVTDFLCFFIFGGEFPTFNFADICVTLSCIALIIYSFFMPESKKKTMQPTLQEKNEEEMASVSIEENKEEQHDGLQ